MISLGGGATNDRFAFLRDLVRAEFWPEAESQIAAIGDTVTWTPAQRLYAAVTFDNLQRWEDADLSYSRALSGSKRQAAVLNNWGVSKLARQDYDAAEQLFGQALDADPQFAHAKVNLALASALKGDFDIPALAMDEIEKAHLFHDVGLIALRRGDKETARRLIQAAVDSHPRHYRKAADLLTKLGGHTPNIKIQ